MSEESIEILRRSFEQWQRSGGTLDAIPLAIYADDVEWDISGYPTVDLPSRGNGRDKLLDLFGDVPERLDELSGRGHGVHR